ncbi:MAG: transmembrane amino acid transporter protein-domain-containing protein [Linnemannia gamsii]|nr:MAG: transmembrane amino acid transporter protein-domain-containing protein [Linnemannia gamsii]
MGYDLEKKTSRPASQAGNSISSDSNEADKHNGDLLAERPSQGSSYQAFFNIVCVVAGTGTLGLPFALAQGGWIGVFLLILSMVMSIYTGILLIKCLYYNGHTRIASYQEVGRHAFGKWGQGTVWFFHSSVIIGVPVMFFILSGSQIRELTKATVPGVSEAAWIWICCCVVSIPFVFMKTLREVSLLSIFGVLATAVLVGVAMVESIVVFPDRLPFEYDIIVVRNLPTVIATMSVCYGGNVVYMHVEEAMRHPRSFNKVLTWAMVFCCVIYSLVAIPGYLTYGPAAKSPILDSLPENASRKIASIMIIAHVLLAAPVLMTSFALEIERILNVTIESRGRVQERIWRTVIRLAIMGVVGGIACLVPYFDSFLSLLGAFGNCMLIYVMPIGFYWKLYGWRTMKWYELVWCAIVLVIGLLGCVIGSIDAIKALHKDFTQGR